MRVPNRVLRDGILTSERVNALSWPAEVFYRRMHSVVDDFGRYYAKPELLRAACYPLQLDKVGNPEIVKWIAEMRKAGLLRTYTVDGKEYLELADFRQRVRADASKFPSGDGKPPSSDRQPPSSDGLGGDVDEGGDGGGRKRRKPATPCPQAFDVTPEMSAWAVEQGWPASRVMPETEKFLDHFRGKGEAKHDWLATWRNWIRKAVEYAKERK